MRTHLCPVILVIMIYKNVYLAIRVDNQRQAVFQAHYGFHGTIQAIFLIYSHL